ncbi:MAG: spondin domain-containing protein [bacterium]
MRRNLRLSALLLSGLFVWSCSEQSPTNTALTSGDVALSKVGSGATYQVTLENLTPATGPGASQVISPPVLASHGHFHIFRVGALASVELAQVAEDAVNGPLVELLGNSAQVYDVVQGGGVIPPGSSDSFVIRVKRGFNRLSLVAMLVNTNDGFVGIDQVQVPLSGSAVYYLQAYDAGSEKNTELKSDIPGPCCGNPGVRVPTHERVAPHPGILGVGDLDPEVYGWTGPAAKLTISRVD